MAYTEYRSSDGSAPVLSGQAGALYAILKACLVDGYGAKAAAGWTEEFSGTNKGVLRPSHGNRFRCRVDDTGTTTARIRGYESMSDVDTGTGEFPTDAQVSGGMYIGKSSTADSTARPWIVFADGKRFILFVAYQAGQTGAFGHTVFGDLAGVSAADLYATVLMAASTSGNALSSSVAGSLGTSSVVHGSNSNSASGYYPRARVGTGTSHGALVAGIGSVSGSSSLTVGPDSAGNVWIDPIVVGELPNVNAAPRGYIPGIYYLRHYLDGTHPAFEAHGDRYLLRCGSSSGAGYMVDPTAGGNSV